MTVRFTLATLAACLALSVPALAEEHPAALHIHDVYARVNGGVGKTGAVFMMIHNNTETDDRLLGVSGDVAKVVELHTHIQGDDGVMQMRKIEGGVPLPSGAMHEFARGGDHVMLMGLTRALKDGDHFPLTLVFEKGGEITVDAVVDNERQPGEGGHQAMHDQMHGHMMHGSGN